MKKKFALPSFIALTSMSLVGAIAGSLAWLSDKANIGTNSKMGGSSEGAYFAYGDGSAADDPATPVKEGPYGIETARQLYNLAWLQYLGYFNKGKNNIIEPKYFELNADIDMTGWAIPPIGTTKYPFIGQFSGKAITGYDQQGNPIYSEPHTISNLQTTNDYDQIVETNKLPGKIKKAESISDVNIVGMFGVVGELANNIPETYDTSVTSIKDFNIKKATITSTASNTLGGIVAGYVNGPISGVVVDGENIVGSLNASKLDFTKGTANYSFNDGKGHSKSFTNISDYGLVGFAEGEYLEDVNTKTVDAYNATQDSYKYIAQDSDDYQGWGGSIPMSDIFTRLSTYRNTAKNTNLQHPTTGTYVENEDGSVTRTYDNYVDIDDFGGKEDISSYSNPQTTSYSYHNYELKNTSGEITSSYGFTTDERSDTNFVCLNGEKTVQVKNAVEMQKTYYKNVTYKRIRSDGNYLAADGTTDVKNVKTSSAASDWYLDGKYVFTKINDVPYYLYIDNGDLKLSQNPSTIWGYNGSNQIYSYTGGASGYQLRYDNNNGWVVTPTNISYCLFTKDGHYMTHPSNQGVPGDTTNASANNARWYYRSNGYATSDSGYYVYRLVAYNSNNPLYTRNSGYNLYAFDGRFLKTSTYYADFSGGSWKGVTYRSEITCIPSFAATYTVTVENSTNVPKEKITESVFENAPVKLNPTFFPLKETNGVPQDTNTGYVVSGGNYGVDQFGDIRFGRFSQDDDLAAGLDTVYTIQSDVVGDSDANSILINNSSIVLDEDRNKAYLKSKEQLQKVLSDNNNDNLDGLHFVDAPINKNRTVIIPRAVINSVSYKNFEVPQDCIDFNLKEKGFINFFAGSYFQNATSGKNNSFFTLHEIQRGTSDNEANPNPITKINEIVAIYSDSVPGHSYVYEYKDGSFSVPFHFVTENNQSVKYPLNDDDNPYEPYSTMGSLYTGYDSTPIFKSSWIGINKLKMEEETDWWGDITGYNGYFYYFDIGMNDGEYALGSVPDGGVGAYLTYLDIGANAKQMFRSEIIEYFKMVDELYVHPKGITLTIISAGLSSNDKNAYCICLKTSYQGTLTMEKVRNGDVEEGRYVGTGDANQESVSYKLPSDVVKDENGTSKTCTPNSSTITEIKRLTFYDYDIITESVNKIVIEDTYVNGVKQTRIVKKYRNYDIVTNTGTEDANMDLFIVEADKKVHNYATKTDDITYTVPAVSDLTKLMSFTVVIPDGGVIKVTFTLTVTSKQVDTHYVYEPSVYDINVTLTKATGVTEDITALVYITEVVNSDGTYTYTLKFNGQTAVITTTPIKITTGS